MARSSADITVKGNNVIDVELKYASTGTAMLKLRLAVERWRRKDNQWEKTNTSFVNIQIWGDLAEQAAGIVQKGMRCEVKGYLEERSWDDTNTGEKRYATQVVAQDVLIPVEDIESLVRVQRKKDGDDNRPTVPMKTPAASAGDPFDEELDF
jgi:single-strand DNA-binding protein